MTTYIVVYLGATVLALLLTPLVIAGARRIDAVDRPGVRTVHERPVPRIGGVAIFVAAMTMIVAVLFLDNDIGVRFRQVQLKLSTLLCSAAFVFLIGLIDDLRGLPARWKFAGELFAAVGLCVAGVRIGSIGIGESLMWDLGLWGCLLTVLWIVGVTNAVNLSDGLDGLAAGVSAVACGAIAIFAVRNGQVMMAVFMLALVGSLSGFLVFNFNPAKIFMGDCGSLFLGFTIAATSVMSVSKSAALVGLALPALALGIPIFDTLFCMLRRFLERRSPFAPDRRHFHHRLLELGLCQRHAVIAIYFVTLLITALGLFMMIRDDLGVLVVFVCLLLLLLLLFRCVGAVHLRQTLTRLRDKYTLAQCRKAERHTFEDLQLKFRRIHGSDQWWHTVCEAARRMEFAWLSLTMTYPDGRIETELWRAAERPANMSRMVHMKIPLADSGDAIEREFEIAIWTNGSLEAASRRATLFGRLLDESTVGSDY
jgi:UDP-GlcNAc:undecaprenyl-phosphate/decaprenyl-phosphate GlcNAc-1-phosphate transferase